MTTSWRSSHLHRWLSIASLGFAVTIGAGSIVAQPHPAQAAPSRSPSAQRSPARPPAMSAAARSRVLAFAAKDLGRSARTLTIRETQSATWSDSCLGLGGPAEICAQAQVPGWWVEIGERNGWGSPSWFYRTDRSGSVVRRAPLAQSLSPEVEQRLLAEAAKVLKRPARSLSVTDLVRKTWDGCLGISPGPAGACTAIALDGWQAIVSDGPRSAVFHLDRTASHIRHNERASRTTARIARVTDRVAPLGIGERFAVELRGGLPGRWERITLMNNGQVFRRRGSEPAQFIGQLPADASIPIDSYELWDLSNLAYWPAGPWADIPVITVVGRFGVIQYSEAVRSQLPPAMGQLMRDWDQAISRLLAPSLTQPMSDLPSSALQAGSG